MQGGVLGRQSQRAASGSPATYIARFCTGHAEFLTFCHLLDVQAQVLNTGAIDQFRILERKCLDHAQALGRFLHGLDDARAAGKLQARDVPYAPHQLAQKENRRRRHDEAAERHNRILRHHHDGEPDQRNQIAADSGDQKIDHRRHRVAPVVSRAMNSDECRSAKKLIFSCSSLSDMRR